MLEVQSLRGCESRGCSVMVVVSARLKACMEGVSCGESGRVGCGGVELLRDVTSRAFFVELGAEDTVNGFGHSVAIGIALPS